MPHRSLRPALRFAVVAVAMVSLSYMPSWAERRVSEEALLFRQLKGGVCTVFGDEGQGSGFLIDSTGLVLTNDHVVGGSRRIRIKFNDSTRVEGILLTSDSKRDIAVVRVDASTVSGLPVLRLAASSDTMVFEGEKVMAMGSPLSQEKIMTVGIVSKVEPKAVISDVNINHGNSGGPLVNMNGEVIAINTFGDFTSQGGPGISGSVLISEAAKVIAEARNAFPFSKAPSNRRLPVVSHVPFPVDSLRLASEQDRFNEKPYNVSAVVSTGKFEVMVVTPIYEWWRSNRYQMELAKRTKKREARSGENSGAADPTRQMREWMSYVGGYAPMVTIQMAPKMGQTAGSLFGNILGAAASGYAGTAYRGNYRYEYKADFLYAEVLKDTIVVDDLNMFRSMVPRAFVSADWNGNYSMVDQARTGVVLMDPSVFAPVGGKAPKIHIKIFSVEKPDNPYEFDLPESTVNRVWEDFAAWRVAAGVQ